MTRHQKHNEVIYLSKAWVVSTEFNLGWGLDIWTFGGYPKPRMSPSLWNIK